MGRGHEAVPGSTPTPGAALAAAVLLWAAAPWGAAAGQVTDEPGSRLELGGAAILLSPLSNLAPGDEAGGGLQLSSSVGVRAAGIWWLGSRLGVGAGGSWVPVDVDRLAATDPEGTPIPGGRLAGADHLLGSLEVVVVLPSVGADVEVEPYLVGGAGLRRLSVEGTDVVPSATDPMVTAGGGFRTLLSDAWLLRLEARDQVSRYEAGGNGRTQHDLTVSIGVGVRP